MYVKTETYHLFNAFLTGIVLLRQGTLTVIYSIVCEWGAVVVGGLVNTTKQKEQQHRSK